MTETARRGRSQELPAPLPPETRTVGQLVAETIRLYGQRFWRVLPLGVGIAALDETAFGHNLNVATLLLWAFAPLLTLSFVAAAAIVAEVRPTFRSAVAAFAVGLVVFAPFPILFRAFVLPALALFAFCGLAVPAAVIERLSPRAALRRGVQLGKADYVHALGSLCTLAIVYFLSRTVLMLLLRGQGDATERIAGFLADLVLSPILFLGSALLYYDQAARVRSSSDGALPRGKPATPGPVRHPSSR
jgi:hypothetical protein